MNVGKLTPKLSGVLSEGIYFLLQLRRSSYLQINLLAHLVELIFDNRQNVGA